MKGDIRIAMRAAAGMHGFRIDREKPLLDEAARAVNRIYSMGLTFQRNDYKLDVLPGTNNVGAALAADAFDEQDIRDLRDTDNARAGFFADIIEAYQGAIDTDREELLSILEDMPGYLKALEKEGWTPDSEPKFRDEQGRIIPPGQRRDDGPSFF